MKKKKECKIVQFTYTIPCAVTHPYDLIQLQPGMQEMDTITPFQQWLIEKYFPKEKGTDAR